MTTWWLKADEKKKGPGRGWWGPPRGTHGDDPKTMTRAQLEKRGYTAVYRGAGPRGVKEIRPSSEGVGGPGVYFYDAPIQARSYADVGGGVITGFVHKNDATFHDVPGSQFSSPHRVVVLADPKKFIRRGTVPTTETTVGWDKKDRERFDKRFETALDEGIQEKKAFNSEDAPTDEFKAALDKLREAVKAYYG